MKILKSGLSLIFLILLAGTANSQDFLYKKIESRLNADQRKKIEKSETYVQKAEKIVNQAKKIESSYANLKSSKKKRKRRKWERKTWKAKKYRIAAEKEYYKAYKMTSKVYSDLIEQTSFHFDTDKTDAEAFSNESDKKLKEANSKINKYKNLSSRRKLKKVNYGVLVKDLNDSRSKKKEALKIQFKALDIIINQDAKKQSDEKDRLAWKNAKSENTEVAYQTYIDGNPSGKHISEARNMINKLKIEREKKEKEEAERVKKMTEQMGSTGYTFKIQLLASKIKIGNRTKKNLYSNINKIEETRVRGWYKYRVGKYGTYKEAYNDAKKIKKQYRNRELFIVAFDKSGNEIPIKDEMKTPDLKGKTPRY